MDSCGQKPRGLLAAPELKLHAARDILYAVLFGTLPWVAWHGIWAVVLVAILVAEIVLTFLAELPTGDATQARR
jgi:hypothetical protein